jgi:signal transduction histidine kinase
MCNDFRAVADVEGHQHRLRSPIAAIVGIAEATLQRDDLDADLVARLRAIRELALDALCATEPGLDEAEDAA